MTHDDLISAIVYWAPLIEDDEAGTILLQALAARGQFSRMQMGQEHLAPSTHQELCNALAALMSLKLRQELARLLRHSHPCFEAILMEAETAAYNGARAYTVTPEASGLGSPYVINFPVAFRQLIKEEC